MTTNTHGLLEEILKELKSMNESLTVNTYVNIVANSYKDSDPNEIAKNILESVRRKGLF